ncbi:YaaR family protein [Bacillus mesophilum]|uniref:YaaR family protein n=1 Tax=Bacillus mesophilum TaxID=1071718 RepID=A0A7V7RHN5_9BACI|nr:YaaR family protein [Bacillus mesophilum]KAB2329112.1 YaaR family protein [Bacillus mesophilum]
MKINQELRLNLDKSRRDHGQPVASSSRFNELVQKQGQKMQFSQLQALMKDIDLAGERLGRSRNFKDMAKFKTLVKNFVKEAVDYGMDLKQSHSWNEMGQGRTLRIVETIDKELALLTEEALNKEGKSIDLLGKIGEIKGLLINLYM